MTQHFKAVLRDEKAFLFNLHGQLLALGTPPEELQILKDAISQTDELFMVMRQ